MDNSHLLLGATKVPSHPLPPSLTHIDSLLQLKNIDKMSVNLNIHFRRTCLLFTLKKYCSEKVHEFGLNKSREVSEASVFIDIFLIKC